MLYKPTARGWDNKEAPRSPGLTLYSNSLSHVSLVLKTTTTCERCSFSITEDNLECTFVRVVKIHG